MYTFVHDGDCYFTLQYNGDVLDTVKSLDPWILNPPAAYPFFCFYKLGQNAGLVDGVTLTGETSGGVIKVGRVIIPGGTLAGSTAAGVLFFRQVSGQIVSGENLRVSTTTYCLAASGPLDSPVGCAPKEIIVQPESGSNNIRIACGGVAPTASTETPVSFGMLLLANANIVLKGWKNVSSFQMINAVAASNAVVNVMVNY